MCSLGFVWKRNIQILGRNDDCDCLRQILNPQNKKPSREPSKFEIFSLVCAWGRTVCVATWPKTTARASSSGSLPARATRCACHHHGGAVAIKLRCVEFYVLCLRAANSPAPGSPLVCARIARDRAASTSRVRWNGTKASSRRNLT
jgi:hypothetical protein